MANSVSRTISDATLSRIIQIESGGRPNIKAQKSSATGLGQFINKTWLGTVKKNRPDLMKGRSQAQVLALRTNPTIMIEMLARFTEENARALGRGYTDGDLYLAHFLGVGTAKVFLRSDPSRPASIAGAAAVNANPSIMRGKTVGQVRAWAAKKMANAGGTNWVAKYYVVAKPQAVAAVDDDEIDENAKAVAVEELSSQSAAGEGVGGDMTETPHFDQGEQYAEIQRRLDARGYHLVGVADGKWGGGTAGAIAAFKNDFPGGGVSTPGPALPDADFMEALAKAEAQNFKRPISKERAEADDKTVAEEAPEIVPVKQGRLAAIWAAVLSFFGMVFNAVIEYFRDAMEMLANIKDYIPTEVLFALVICLCGFFAWKANSGAKGISTAFKTGERL